jgi:protein-tyrosine phosphatase
LSHTRLGLFASSIQQTHEALRAKDGLDSPFIRHGESCRSSPWQLAAEWPFPCRSIERGKSRIQRRAERNPVKKAIIAVLLLLGAAHAPCQNRTDDTHNLDREPAEAGSKLKYFGSVDEGVYKGSRPKSDADYRFLQSLHVKYIVDLQVLPFMTRSERRKAKQYGIILIPGIMNASPIPPSEKHVDRILAILHDERYRPIYVHCKFGRDRTSVIAALYKMYFLGMSPDEATQYLHEAGYGFKYGWLRSGLTRYLNKHPTPPADLLGGASSR